jgi:hypothetical protein
MDGFDAAARPGVEPSDDQKRKLIAKAELGLLHLKALLAEMRWFTTSHCPRADGMADGIANVERSLNMMERETRRLEAIEAEILTAIGHVARRPAAARVSRTPHHMRRPRAEMSSGSGDP